TRALSVPAHQSARHAPGTLAPWPWLRPFLQRAAPHGQRPVFRHLSGRRAAACHASGRREPMSGAYRIAGAGRLTPARPLRFTFDGRTLEGLAGDTLASALLANGIHLVGRSVKYHRPRGILSAGPEEPNALVGIDRGQGRFTPNVRATVQELYDDLTATSQNRWPSLALDLGAVSGLLSPLFPAGFYYKTFMWPR